MTGRDTLLDGLRGIVGMPYVLTHDHPQADPAPGKTTGANASGAARWPCGTLPLPKQVAEVVRVCAAHQDSTGTSITPQSVNIRLVVGSVPDASGCQIVLSQQRMNTVRAIDAAKP